MNVRERESKRERERETKIVWERETEGERSRECKIEIDRESQRACWGERARGRESGRKRCVETPTSAGFSTKAVCRCRARAQHLDRF